MIKRLALLCCILLLPTIAAAAASPGESTNYGDLWVGGQVGAIFTSDTEVTFRAPNLFQGHITRSFRTDPGVLAGAIVGYNFCMPYRQVWERYFGLALDFQWNQFNHPGRTFIPRVGGDQFALAFLGRLQYPFMGSESFTRGRLVPFLMFGPAIVWTNSDFSNFRRGSSDTSTNVGIVAEVGVEFFIIPQLSIGPSFRYRHVFGPNFEVRGVDMDAQLDQFMVLGRLAYHF
jgi:opacity protein-like surface antigen